MLDINKNIIEAKSFLFDNNINSNCERIWFGATESIKNYFELLEWENTKKVLTVCSSGDQVLNLVNYGIKYIDSFDINPLTFPYLQLKIGLILALSYKEYIKIFEKLSITNINETQEYEIFCKIKDYINHPYDFFWEQLYLENLIKNKHNTMEPGLLGKLCKNYIPFQISNLRNQYLSSEKEYEKTRENLRKSIITFKTANLLEIHKIFSTNQYDKIFLSNIFDYLSFNYNINELDKFIRTDIAKLLNDNGEILTAYIYHYINNYEYNGINFKNLGNFDTNILKKLYCLKKVPHINDYSGIEFESNDAVLIYKKNYTTKY